MNKLTHELDTIFSDILSGLSSAGIARTARTVGQEVRRSQQRRIRSQKNPDGSAWPQRKRRITRSQQGIKFIWNGEVRELKNWHGGRGKYGRTITGYDTDRNDIRTFYRSDIERYLAINTRSLRRDSTKKAPMFERLRTLRYLKMYPDQQGVSIGYSGVAARIARVHQYGLRDQVGPGVIAKYPQRELLGISAADERLIYNAVINSLGSAGK
ncbi:TPA: phage virion morphogenesis protein [Salmonella enterica subsp. salamae]|uniref:Phage virion morphogenesis protein n=2 Tax=Salmonella enterica TaxID=28901 RepID=A0A5X2X727_SALEN|nr:phage virion morphogenesis protein [Salmonella enterica subsp. enterica serovar Enteritidis]EKR2076104.1 phage virion morphogenesis protein [Salmonella enterica subsp. salamae serovar 9,46:l,w:e,n,x]HAC6952921.1 phage virion morphogenesis protein [Salmonella enterica subsp. salamae]HAU3147587.1 phage virion morphogenesis protein [Salmonella enterica subsp. salamae]HCM1962461.1 phage virion morphogenesis protein [Salmonella enterica subsp. salamae serovar 56:l,v:z39]